MTAKEQILEIVRKAYQIEVDGHTFYSMTAATADKAAVKELFGKLAADELQHKAYLTNVLKNYEEQGVSAFQGTRLPEGARSFADRVFTVGFRKQAAGADFEVAVVSIGMQLESRAVTFFTKAAQEATDGEVRDFYRFLADWETEHLDSLKDLSDSLRTDFWDRSGFSPT